MKKLLAAILVLLVVSSMFSITASAAEKTVNYYDENGNAIIIKGMYYNSQGEPMYNARCYYLDENGDPVYVGGCRAYYYDEDGNLVPGNYYYNQNGNAVARPSSYPGGWGCGMYYYDSNGNVVNQTSYYDESGNLVSLEDLPQPPAYRGGGRGGCCGRWQ